MKRLPEPWVGTAFISLVALSLPWFYVLWLTAPGKPRPLLSDVVAAFASAHMMMSAWGVERAFETRRPSPAAVGIGLAVLNAVVFAGWRVSRGGGWGESLPHLIVIAGMAGAVTLLLWLFPSLVTRSQPSLPEGGERHG